MSSLIKSKPWIPYAAPFCLYMFMLGFESPRNLLWFYPLKAIAVAGLLACFWKFYDELRIPCSRESLTHATFIGLIVIVIWIAIDSSYPHVNEMLGKPSTPFDPTGINPASLRWTFISIRIVGAVVVVPLMEELFWRAFLIRWLISEDFKAVPLGTFTLTSFGITVLLLGAEHNQWLAGLICGVLYNWLYYRTRNVTACVVAHAVSNAALAGWVLARGDWKLW